MLSPDIALGPVYWPRFESKFIPEPNSGCWLWTGAQHEWGYGRMKCEGHMHPAHRLIFERCAGIDIPDHLQACHRCDTPSCVNPEHIFVGSQQDNINDCCAKGRMHLGERNGQCKLTDAEANEAASRIGRISEIAAEFGIHPEYLRQLRRKEKRAALAAGTVVTKAGFRKLGPEQIREIRAASGSHASLARRFGVRPGAIARVRSGKTYSMLP